MVCLFSLEWGALEGPSLSSLESFLCIQCYSCAIEVKPVKPLSSPKSPRCKLLFCLVLVFWGERCWACGEP